VSPHSDTHYVEVKRPLTQVRLILAAFSSALILSGITAIFPLDGLRLLAPVYEPGSLLHRLWPEMAGWLALVRTSLGDVSANYPFLLYGYDWLAFGHFIIAIPFLIALRDPLSNTWVVPFGIAACLLVLPHAIVFGAIRGIPLYWRFVDTLFGIGGLLLLLLIWRQLRSLSAESSPRQHRHESSI
jgi:hypothetical protein